MRGSANLHWSHRPTRLINGHTSPKTVQFLHLGSLLRTMKNQPGFRHASWATVHLVTPMSPRDPFCLQFGPYRSPDCCVGQRVACALRGGVTVFLFSNGPIPWPM